MNDSKLITAAAVRDHCGGLCDLTLGRWLKRSEMAFPKPLVINRRRYWRHDDIAAWLEARGAAE